jgi:hypothetical protein
MDLSNVRGSRGPSGFDLTHVLSVNTLYELPKGAGKALQTHTRRSGSTPIT